MSLDEVVIEGTITPEGTLELDRKPDLAPGRVTVVLRPDAAAKSPRPLDDAFFQMMENIWAGQKARGFVPRTVEEVEAERQEIRAGWAKRQETIERLQEESRRLRQEAESRKESL